ncbi:MAG: sensor histidine kinase [Crocinitomicaceae bacterium]
MNSEVVRPQKTGGFDLNLVGDVNFKKIEFTQVSVKELPEMYRKDKAILDIDYLDKKHGLPIGQVYTLAKLEDGRMIISGTKNFSIYDGIEFRTYHIETGFGEVRDFFLGSTGKMWIATTEGCFYFKNNELFQFTTIGKCGLWRCYEDKKGNIWLTTFNQGVFYFNDNKCYNLTCDTQFKEAKSFAEDEEGNIYLSAAPGVYQFSKNDTLFYPFKNTEGQTEKLFYWNHHLLMGRFGGGLYLLKEEGFQRLEMGIERFSIYSFDTTTTGLWIGSYGGGLVNLNEDWEYNLFTVDHGIIGNGGHKIAADGFGNIWIGDIFSGFSVFKESNFKISPELSDFGTITKIITQQDSTYIFCSTGRPKLIANNKIFELKAKENYDSPYYHSAVDFQSSNEIWLESYTRGILLFKDKKLTFHNYSNVPQDIAQHQPMKDQFGKVWSLNFRSNASFLLNDTVYTFNKNHPLSNESIQRTIKDNEENAYLIGDKHYYWIQENNLNKVQFEQEDELINTAFEAENKGIWLVSKYYLNRIYQDEIIEQYPINPSFSNQVISAKEIKGKMYFAVDAGIVVLSREKQKININWITEEYGQHLLSPGNFHQWKDQIIYSSNLSNYQFDENWNLKNYKTGTAEITEIFINNEKIDLSNQLKIDRDDELKIKAQIVNWGKNRKDYFRLFSDDKSANFQAFQSKFLTFSNLASGDYQLEIMTANSAGKSEIASLSFYVKPYWYESKMFYGLVVCIILILSFFYFKRRVRKTEALNERLEQAVIEKTEELRQEKLEVEQQLNEKELLLKEINHRVKNNMQMVNSLVELQKSKEDSPTNKESLTKISQRVKALSIAHQHLYLQSQYETINVCDYLTLLITKLTANLDISTELNLDKELMLPIEKGQALGLIINELVSNSIKHAKLEGQLNINVKLSNQDNEVMVDYQDNGPGYDPTKVTKGSLGNTLVDSFIKRQLNGEYELNTLGNYSIKIIFGK